MIIKEFYMRIRAQSLQPGDKLRCKPLNGTVVSVARNVQYPNMRTVTVHVVVEQSSGKIVCKDFSLGYCLNILERPNA